MSSNRSECCPYNVVCASVVVTRRCRLRTRRRARKLAPTVRRTATARACHRRPIDILPALKREDSVVGRRAVQRYPEGNFLTPRGEYRVRALHVAPRARVWRIRRPRWTRYPLVPYPLPPQLRRPNTGQPPTVGTWADTGRAIDHTPLTRAECNRERGVFWYAVAPSFARSLPTVSSDGWG